MLYEVAHFLRDRVGFLWDAMEWGNSVAFAAVYRKNLKRIPKLLQSLTTENLLVKLAEVKDVAAMAKFFEDQPDESFHFFRPHAFDEKTLRKYVYNRSFLAFLVYHKNQIVGYFFLRCFVNGKCFKGYIVDHRYRRRQIATYEGIVMNQVAALLKLAMFGSISPENEASMAAARAVNDLKIIKTLDGGDLFIEFLPKTTN